MFPTVVLAKEADIDVKLPKWATPECILTIYRIVQHETGNMKSDEVFSFMTTQIVHDIHRLGCKNLTQWRWSIGYYPESKVSNQVRLAVLKTILYPQDFPICNFIGNMHDRIVWKSYGYDVTIGYSKTINSLTVVGVGCKH